MILGVALPPAYLAGATVKFLTEALGDPTAFLQSLRQAGVQAIELRSVGTTTDPGLLPNGPWALILASWRQA